MAGRKPNTFIPSQATGAAAHQQLTSTGTADVKVFAVPKGAAAVILEAATTDARVTFDGSAPSATSGILIKAGLQPVFIPTAGLGSGAVVQFASTAAAASVVDALFLE